MDSDELCKDLGGIVRRGARAVTDENGAMDFERVDLASEIDQMERNINYYKSKLQSCREKYESVELEILDVRRSQRKILLEFEHNAQMVQNLQEHFQRIQLDHEATCADKSDSYADLDERVRTTIDELTAQRSTLMQELTQLKRNTEDNFKKLGRANAMITEQEEKNKALLWELRKKSEDNASRIPQNTRTRINALLENLKEEMNCTTAANGTTE